MNIIVYGSLMNQVSLESTLGRPATLTKTEVLGYARIFNAPFDGYAFFNLQADPASFIEVAYFELEGEELVKFAEREAGSDLIEVKPGYFAFVWPANYTQELAVLQSYIDLCQEGADALGIDMQKGLISPQLVVDDTLEPLYA